MLDLFGGCVGFLFGSWYPGEGCRRWRLGFIRFLLKMVWSGLMFGFGLGLGDTMDWNHWIWLRLNIIIKHTTSRDWLDSIFNITVRAICQWVVQKCMFSLSFQPLYLKRIKTQNQGYLYCIWPFLAFLRVKVGMKWWVFAYSLSKSTEHEIWIAYKITGSTINYIWSIEAKKMNFEKIIEPREKPTKQVHWTHQ